MNKKSFSSIWSSRFHSRRKFYCLTSIIHWKDQIKIVKKRKKYSGKKPPPFLLVDLNEGYRWREILQCRRTNEIVRNEKRKIISLFDVFVRSLINNEKCTNFTYRTKITHEKQSSKPHCIVRRLLDKNISSFFFPSSPSFLPINSWLKTMSTEAETKGKKVEIDSFLSKFIFLFI